jgi:2-phosphoglycolate phosphatase
VTPRGVLFDLDGTLIDSYEAIATSLNHALGTLGRPTRSTGEVRRLVGHGLDSLLEQAVGRADRDAGVRLFRERYAEVFLDSTRALPDVGVTLAELRRRGYRMGVASNKPARFGGPLLEHLGLADSLQAVLGPDLVTHAKPHPEMLELLLLKLGVEASEAVYVGDMPLDVESGRRAGLETWLVPTGSAPRENLVDAGAARLVDRFGDLLDLLPGVLAQG